MALIRNAALNVPALRRLYDSRNALQRERDVLVDERARLQHSMEELSARLADSENRPSQSPFFHYNTSFDPIALMHRHAALGLTPKPGYLTNFLGVRIDPKFFPEILMDRAGQVEGIPIPANWHADVAEWGVALRAIELAQQSFTMIELGCGWGCWMNNTGVAARRAGLDVHVIGVEGDEGHVGFARESLEVNGFQPEQVSLHRGIAAAQSGLALFPRQERAGVKWGLEPIFGATEEQRAKAVESGDYDELPMVSLSELVNPHPRIDLLHIDIQGGEADLIAGCLSILREKVAYILIGTHSRQIEGQLFDTLLQDGWHLEMERPAIVGILNGSPSISVDGVQGWRNLRLLPLS